MTAPVFSLEPPHTHRFTARRAHEGDALNRFALGLRVPQRRADFLRDPQAVMAEAGLDEALRALVLARDWTGLLAAGGHLQAILKVAATVGESLWHIGAHNAGVGVEALQAACPRRVDGLPEALA